MRPASAREKLLASHSHRKLRVLVVWEPILPTDFTSPSSSAVGRIADQRARKFWDRNHLVGLELDRRAAAKPPAIKPACCLSRGFYWDDVILYAPHAHWHDEPPPAFWSGPVVRVIPALESALNNMKLAQASAPILVGERLQECRTDHGRADRSGQLFLSLGFL